MFENFLPLFVNHSAEYGVYNLAYKLVLLFVFVCVDIYLIKMGINMQRLLRKTGHVKGYCGEIMIAVVYTLWCGHYYNYHILKPTVIFLIYN